MIMRQVADIKMPLRGVFITGASSWKGPENKFAKYVITPGQWAADVRSSCFVFGTNENYVNLFAQKHGYEPDYMVAMSTAAGVVFQLALQQAGTVRVSKIMEALSTLSAETIAGRVRFSYNHRNIGRDPILSQYQVRLGRSASPCLRENRPFLISDSSPSGEATCSVDSVALWIPICLVMSEAPALQHTWAAHAGTVPERQLSGSIRLVAPRPVL